MRLRAPKFFREQYFAGDLAMRDDGPAVGLA